MFIHHTEVAGVFSQIADLLEIKGANPFRIRAYRNAARTLNTLTTSVQTTVEEQRDLKDLPGIGNDLAGKIIEIVATGTCALREQLRREMPPFIHELLLAAGQLGRKMVHALTQSHQRQRLFRRHRVGAALLRLRRRVVPNAPCVICPESVLKPGPIVRQEKMRGDKFPFLIIGVAAYRFLRDINHADRCRS